jgi:2-polyprenyl-6-methoxyphenol hydroxylase-like FAD-dependent oxidoreductase
MHTATIDDLQPINSWFKGNVCLIGDAAHATTPNMGQGACQAIEDANILAQCLYKYKPEMAFPLFQKL